LPLNFSDREKKMPTIEETLIDIENLQNEIDESIKKGIIKQTKFIDDLMNFTTTYYFELLSHCTLEILQRKKLLSSEKIVKKYFSYFNKIGYSRNISDGKILVDYSLFGTYLRNVLRNFIKKYPTKQVKR